MFGRHGPGQSCIVFGIAVEPDPGGLAAKQAVPRDVDNRVALVDEHRAATDHNLVRAGMGIDVDDTCAGLDPVAAPDHVDQHRLLHLRGDDDVVIAIGEANGDGLGGMRGDHEYRIVDGHFQQAFARGDTYALLLLIRA
ncbi:hypothetical protein D3C75_828570 [compost metagenome]